MLVININTNIMKYFPDSSKKYPVYILSYWLVIWFSLFAIHAIKIIPAITDSGMFVEKKICLEYMPSGRFDEGEECASFGESRYVPVGIELRDYFFHIGKTVAIFVLIMGIFLWWGNRNTEKKKI